MQENKKKWMELCERAADEQDPKKLAALILQINGVLEVKELRLRGEVTTPPTVEAILQI
jgi:divalent metal cation (Fe/Co/Zn/Cd) transporter